MTALDIKDISKYFPPLVLHVLSLSTDFFKKCKTKENVIMLVESQWVIL